MPALTSSHPLFLMAFAKPCVLVFERSAWAHPTDEQMTEYERKRAIVESLDGRMATQPWETAGRNPPLSAEDVAGILLSVQAEYPNARIADHWNGLGCYSMSVRLELQGSPDSETPQAEQDNL